MIIPTQQGEVDVLKGAMSEASADPAGERWLTTLKAGDSFGERALLLDEVRAHESLA